MESSSDDIVQVLNLNGPQVSATTRLKEATEVEPCSCRSLGPTVRASVLYSAIIEAQRGITSRERAGMLLLGRAIAYEAHGAGLPMWGS
jgi:hypothetical protein